MLLVATYHKNTNTSTRHHSAPEANKMTPCEKRVCCEITEAYKPWVKDGGVKWLFRDAYTRVGGHWAIWSKKDKDAIKYVP